MAMAGSTTEFLAEDIRELRSEVHEIRVNLNSFKSEMRTLVKIGKFSLEPCLA